MSNQRNVADLDLFVQNFAAPSTAKPTAPLELKGGGWNVAAWSDDGRQMILRNYKSINESELFRFDVASRKLEPLHPTKPPVAYSGLASNVAFSADGKGSFLTSDEESEFQTLRHLDLASGQLTALSARNQLTRWTTSETGGFNPATFPEPSLIQYPTFDQVNGKPRMIPAFVYRPKDATGKTPVLLNIHGGPERQSYPNFNPLNALLYNELGITIVVPNVCALTGYGKTCVALDNGPKREDAVKDIGALLDWIATQPNLDASRVAVFGSSYGGYMSLAAMTNYNDRMRCDIDLFGISNFVTFLQNTSSYGADRRRAEYGDERDPAMRRAFETFSPIYKIQNITKPMLVYQCKNDPRVPLSESEQMVAGLKKQGTTAWLKKPTATTPAVP